MSRMQVAPGHISQPQALPNISILHGKGPHGMRLGSIPNALTPAAVTTVTLLLYILILKLAPFDGNTTDTKISTSYFDSNR